MRFNQKVKENRINLTRIMIFSILASILILFSVFFFGINPVNGQSGANAKITIPDTDNFPTLTTSLDIHDDQGQFIHQLQPSEVTIQEDDHTDNVEGIREINLGVRVIVAINPGYFLAIQDQQGVSRYDTIGAGLENWISGLDGSTQNDYSLLTNTGSLITYTTEPADWLAVYKSYQPDLRNASPNLDSLNLAVTMSADVTPNPEMERMILYITPTPDNSQLNILPDLITRANSTGVHIFVWMVGPPSDLETNGAVALIQLTEQTGGKFFSFSGTEALPDVQSYLEPFRYIYQLTYQSTINTSGTHSLQVLVNKAGTEIDSAIQSFDLNVLPPNPMFVSPPTQLTRQGLQTSPTSTEGLSPQQQGLQIMVEFPDGHPRDLLYSRLYVDGTLAGENTAAPFTSFTWDLAEYTTTGHHILTVEVQDSLGLTTMSAEVPILITVNLITPTPVEVVPQKENMVPIIAIIVAGSALIIVLLIGILRHGRENSNPLRIKKRDPLNQAIRKVGSEESLPAATRVEKMNRLQQAMKDGTTVARMVEISEDPSQNKTVGSIPIGTGEVIFGRDPSQATCIIDSPSIEAVHARLLLDSEGNFMLYDQGSIAGTWVNYAPISSEGAHLEHGDLVHIGKVAFRFELIHPTNLRKPQIRIME
jgi:hypothetical protein